MKDKKLTQLCGRRKWNTPLGRRSDMPLLSLFLMHGLCSPLRNDNRDGSGVGAREEEEEEVEDAAFVISSPPPHIVNLRNNASSHASDRERDP